MWALRCSVFWRRLPLQLFICSATHEDEQRATWEIFIDLSAAPVLRSEVWSCRIVCRWAEERGRWNDFYVETFPAFVWRLNPLFFSPLVRTTRQKIPRKFRAKTIFCLEWRLISGTSKIVSDCIKSHRKGGERFVSCFVIWFS